MWTVTRPRQAVREWTDALCAIAALILLALLEAARRLLLHTP